MELISLPDAQVSYESLKRILELQGFDIIPLSPLSNLISLPDAQASFVSLKKILAIQGYNLERISLNLQSLKNKNEPTQFTPTIERLSQQEERGRIEGGTRNVEAAIVAARSKGTGSDAEQSVLQEEAVEQYAKDNNIWYDYSIKTFEETFGEQFDRGSEAKVYYNDGDRYVTKAIHLYYSADPLDFSDRIALHNTVFKSTAYELIGFGKNEDGLFVAIVKQPFIRAKRKATVQEIKKELTDRGFKHLKKNDYYNADYLLEDMSSDNVLVDAYGNCQFVDTRISLNTKELGLGGSRTINNFAMGGKVYDKDLVGKKKYANGGLIINTNERIEWGGYKVGDIVDGSQISKLSVGGDGEKGVRYETYPDIPHSEIRESIEDAKKNFKNTPPVVYDDGLHRRVAASELGHETILSWQPIEQKYEDGGLFAPNGKKSSLTAEQYKLVRTPEFKAWFGDWEKDPERFSKVVDENGEPMVVYHGTNSKFIEFKEGLHRARYFFTKDKDLAKTYGEYLIEVFLNLRNPFITNDNNKYTEMFSNIEDGYDGIIYNCDTRIFVAFINTQIKLADGTNTTFDAVNPDIRYAKGGRVVENIKPAVEFDEKFGTSVSQKYKFPKGYTSDEAWALVKKGLNKKNVKLYQAVNSLTEEHFLYKGIESLDERTKSEFNKDDIWFSVDGRYGVHPLSEKVRGEIKRFSIEVCDKVQWVMSPETWKRVKPELIRYKEKYGLDTFDLDKRTSNRKMEIDYESIQLESGGINQSLNINIEGSAKKAVEELDSLGHKCLVVGGAVRDAILGIAAKDIDIEVYNIDYATLESILSKYGRVDLVGKSFGIIKFKSRDGYEYDFSVPRKESKVGVGHTGFSVFFDKDMTPKEAAERRDFTFNALAYDPITQELYDYFGGVDDLNKKIIRATSDKFSEDPLRIFRAMQFQSRMGFSIAKETMETMREMVISGVVDEIPKERVSEEWMKWAVKGRHPELIFGFIHGTCLDKELPYIGDMANVNQDPEWHPEGDVEVHTGFVLQAAVEVADREHLEGDERAVLIFAALCHDFAKPMTTEVIDGRITARGHEKAGGVLAKEFLTAIGIKSSIIEKVVPLVENHLEHVNINVIPHHSGKLKAVKKLSKRLYPANIRELVLLTECDASGRPPLPKGLSDKGKALLELAKEVNVEIKKQEPIIMGRHLIQLGWQPSVKFKEILDATMEAEEEGLYSDVEGGKEWVKQNFKYGGQNTSNFAKSNNNIMDRLKPAKTLAEISRIHGVSEAELSAEFQYGIEEEYQEHGDYEVASVLARHHLEKDPHYYSKMKEIEDDAIENEINGDVVMADGGKVHKYKLGDKYRSDFDIDGMLKKALKADATWSVEKLDKLCESLRDMNYHKSVKFLWDAINNLKEGDKVEAEKNIKEFHNSIKEDLEEYESFEGATMADGGKISEDLWMKIKGRVVFVVGIDDAIAQFEKEYVVSPYHLLYSAVAKGFIEVDEIDEKMWRAAINEAEDVDSYYGDSGQGISSSDMNAFISSMLNDAGIKMEVVNNKYTRMADGGEVEVEEDRETFFEMPVAETLEQLEKNVDYILSIYSGRKMANLQVLEYLSEKGDLGKEYLSKRGIETKDKFDSYMENRQGLLRKGSYARRREAREALTERHVDNIMNIALAQSAEMDKIIAEDGGAIKAYEGGNSEDIIKTFGSKNDAKKFAKANKWKYETITFEDEQGDTIVVKRDDKFKDIDWLFTEQMANGGDVKRVAKGYVLAEKFGNKKQITILLKEVFNEQGEEKEPYEFILHTAFYDTIVKWKGHYYVSHNGQYVHYDFLDNPKFAEAISLTNHPIIRETAAAQRIVTVPSNAEEAVMESGGLTEPYALWMLRYSDRTGSGWHFATIEDAVNYADNKGVKTDNDYRYEIRDRATGKLLLGKREIKAILKKDKTIDDYSKSFEHGGDVDAEYEYNAAEYIAKERDEADSLLYSSDTDIAKAMICKAKIELAESMEEKAGSGLEKNVWMEVCRIWKNCLEEVEEMVISMN